jgi:hypothetical protein
MSNTKADLESVLELLEEGWCQLRPSRHYGSNIPQTYGCLGDKMVMVANQGQGVHNGPVARVRYDNMSQALGFGRPNEDNPHLSNLGSSLTTWNDYEADWDMVKERVKRTIGEL